MDAYKEIFLMQQTYATLFAIANKIQMKGDKYLEKLTSRQNMAMIAVAHLKEDERTINNVAAKLGTTKQSAKQLIAILEAKGYLITTPSQRDKRAVNLKITEPGQQAMVECAEKGLYFFADLFREFSGEEMEKLWRMLKKLYRFDGHEQDDFEEEVALELTAEQYEIQREALEEFERRRNSPGKGKRGMCDEK